MLALTPESLEQNSSSSLQIWTHDNNVCTFYSFAVIFFCDDKYAFLTVYNLHYFTEFVKVYVNCFLLFFKVFTKYKFVRIVKLTF